MNHHNVYFEGSDECYYNGLCFNIRHLSDGIILAHFSPYYCFKISNNICNFSHVNIIIHFICDQSTWNISATICI